MKKALSDAPGKVLLLCSEFAYPLMQTVLSGMALPEDAWDLIYVPNITFGGTIRAAGLLCDARQNRLHLSSHQRQLFALLKCCAHMVNACHTEFHVCSSSVILQGRRGIRLPQTRLLRRFARISAR